MQLICDMLADINKDISKLKPNIGNQYLKNVFLAALLPQNRFILPEGAPPYKANELPSAQLHGAMWGVCKKINIFWRKDLKPLQRESLFITSLESVSKQEAELLLAIKDQTLYKLYPNLTLENISETYPGYLK